MTKDGCGGQFAIGKHTGNYFWTICSPGISRQKCISCLDIAATTIPIVLKDWNRQSAVISFYPQCIFQYGTIKFYNESIVDLSRGPSLQHRGMYVHIYMYYYYFFIM